MEVPRSSDHVSDVARFTELKEELRMFKQLLFAHGLIFKEAQQELANTSKFADHHPLESCSISRQYKANHSYQELCKRYCQDNQTNDSEVRTNQSHHELFKTIHCRDNQYNYDQIKGSTSAINQSNVNHPGASRSDVNQSRTREYADRMYKYSQYKDPKSGRHLLESKSSKYNDMKANLFKNYTTKDNPPKNNYLKDRTSKDSQGKDNPYSDSFFASRGSKAPVVETTEVKEAIKREISEKEKDLGRHFCDKRSGLSFLLYMICSSCGSDNVAYEATCLACKSKIKTHNCEKAHINENQITSRDHVVFKVPKYIPKKKFEKVKCGDHDVQDCCHGLKESNVPKVESYSDVTSNIRFISTFSPAETIIHSDRKHRNDIIENCLPVDSKRSPEMILMHSDRTYHKDVIENYRPVGIRTSPESTLVIHSDQRHRNDVIENCVPIDSSRSSPEVNLIHSDRIYRNDVIENCVPIDSRRSSPEKNLIHSDRRHCKDVIENYLPVDSRRSSPERNLIHSDRKHRNGVIENCLPVATRSLVHSNRTQRNHFEELYPNDDLRRSSERSLKYSEGRDHNNIIDQCLPAVRRRSSPQRSPIYSETRYRNDYLEDYQPTASRNLIHWNREHRNDIIENCFNFAPRFSPERHFVKSEMRHCNNILEKCPSVSRNKSPPEKSLVHSNRGHRNDTLENCLPVAKKRSPERSMIHSEMRYCNDIIDNYLPVTTRSQVHSDREHRNGTLRTSPTVDKSRSSHEKGLVHSESRHRSDTIKRYQPVDIDNVTKNDDRSMTLHCSDNYLSKKRSPRCEISLLKVDKKASDTSIKYNEILGRWPNDKRINDKAYKKSCERKPSNENSLDSPCQNVTCREDSKLRGSMDTREIKEQAQSGKNKEGSEIDGHRPVCSKSEKSGKRRYFEYDSTKSEMHIDDRVRGKGWWEHKGNRREWRRPRHWRNFGSYKWVSEERWNFKNVTLEGGHPARKRKQNDEDGRPSKSRQVGQRNSACAGIDVERKVPRSPATIFNIKGRRKNRKRQSKSSMVSCRPTCCLSCEQSRGSERIEICKDGGQTTDVNKRAEVTKGLKNAQPLNEGVAPAAAKPNINNSVCCSTNALKSSSKNLSEPHDDRVDQEKCIIPMATAHTMPRFDTNSNSNPSCRAENFQSQELILSNRVYSSQKTRNPTKTQIIFNSTTPTATKSEEVHSEPIVSLEKEMIIMKIEDICHISPLLSPLIESHPDVHDVDHEEEEFEYANASYVRSKELESNHANGEKTNKQASVSNPFFKIQTRGPNISSTRGGKNDHWVPKFDRVLNSGDSGDDISCTPPKRFKHALNGRCTLIEECYFSSKQSLLKSPGDVHSNMNNSNNDKDDATTKNTGEATLGEFVSCFKGESEEYEVMDITYEYDMLDSPIVLKASDRVYDVKNILNENRDESPETNTLTSLDANFSTDLNEVRKSDDMLALAMERAGLTELTLTNFMDDNFDLDSVIFADDSIKSSSEFQDADTFLDQIFNGFSPQEDILLPDTRDTISLNEISQGNTESDSVSEAFADNHYQHVDTLTELLSKETIEKKGSLTRPAEIDSSSWVSEPFTEDVLNGSQYPSLHNLDGTESMAPYSEHSEHKALGPELWDQSVHSKTQKHIESHQNQQNVHNDMVGRVSERNTNEGVSCDNSDASCDRKSKNNPSTDRSSPMILRGNKHLKARGVDNNQTSGACALVSTLNEIKLKNRTNKRMKKKPVVIQELDYTGANGSDSSDVSNKARRSKRIAKVKQKNGTSFDANSGKTKVIEPTEVTPSIRRGSQVTYQRPTIMLRRKLRSTSVRNLKSSAAYRTISRSATNTNNNSNSMNNSFSDISGDQSDCSSSATEVSEVTDQWKQKSRILKQQCRELDQKYRKRYQSPSATSLKSSLSSISSIESNLSTAKDAISNNAKKQRVDKTNSTGCLGKSESDMSADDKAKYSLANFVTRIRGAYGDQFPVSSKVSRARRHELCNRYLQHHNLRMTDISYLDKKTQRNETHSKPSHEDVRNLAYTEDGASCDTSSQDKSHKEALSKLEILSCMTVPKQVGESKTLKLTSSSISLNSDQRFSDSYDINDEGYQFPERALSKEGNCESVGSLAETAKAANGKNPSGITVAKPSKSAITSRLSALPVSPHAKLVGKIKDFEDDFNSSFLSTYDDASSRSEGSSTCSASPRAKGKRSKKPTKTHSKADKNKKLLAILKKFENISSSSNVLCPVLDSSKSIRKENGAKTGVTISFGKDDIQVSKIEHSIKALVGSELRHKAKSPETCPSETQSDQTETMECGSYNHPLLSEDIKATVTTDCEELLLHCFKSANMEKGGGDTNFKLNGSPKADVQNGESSPSGVSHDKVVEHDRTSLGAMDSADRYNSPRPIEKSTMSITQQMGSITPSKRASLLNPCAQSTTQVPFHLPTIESHDLPFQVHAESLPTADIERDDLKLLLNTPKSHTTIISPAKNENGSWPVAKDSLSAESTSLGQGQQTTSCSGPADGTPEDTEDVRGPVNADTIPASKHEISSSIDNVIIDSIVSENTKVSRGSLMSSSITRPSSKSTMILPARDTAKATEKGTCKGNTLLTLERLSLHDNGDASYLGEELGSDSDVFAFKSSTCVLSDSSLSKRPHGGEISMRASILSPIPEELDEDLGSYM